MTHQELTNQKPITFFVVVNKNNEIVWRDLERTQGASYGCAYTSRHWADKKASKIEGSFVYSVQGLYMPNYKSDSESDHHTIAKATPFFN